MAGLRCVGEESMVAGRFRCPAGRVSFSTLKDPAGQRLSLDLSVTWGLWDQEK